MIQYGGRAIISLVGIIFNVIPEIETKIPVDRIQALIESFRERQRTGLIRLAYNSEKYLYLFFKRGEVLNTYFIEADARELISSDYWAKWINSAGDAYAKVAPLSSFGLFISKLLIQSNNGKMEFLYNQAQLSEYFTVFARQPELCLLQFDWNNAMGAVLFPGEEMEPYSLFLSQETIFDGTGISQSIFKWNEPRCTATTFMPGLSIDAWQEYYLRKSFADICNHTIGRFEVMTGRGLVDSLVRLVAIFASKNNLDIMILSRRLIDHEVFSSPQDAAQSYRQILKEVFGHFSAVVGSRLLALTLREIVATLPENERETIHAFKLLPEGYSL